MNFCCLKELERQPSNEPRIKNGVEKIFSFNGIGTTLYGREMQYDGTYIATKWIIVIYIPIIPLSSYLVLHDNIGLFSSEYQMIQIPLHWKQVFKTYLFVILLFSLIGFIGLLLHFFW